MARQFTGQHYVGPDGIFHYPWVDDVTGESGEELSYEGPTQGAQAQPVSPTAPTGSNPSAPGSTYLYPGTPSPSWWNAPSNPWSIGAGTSEQGYGWGVPGFGQDPIKILTEYLPYLQSQTTGQRGGYIPGSGTYNIPPGPARPAGNDRRECPTRTCVRAGRAPATPPPGREAQTPEEWVQGGPLWTSTVTSNWGQTAGDGGLDYIANLFLRSDTPSGIGTPAWSAPERLLAGPRPGDRRRTHPAHGAGLAAALRRRAIRRRRSGARPPSRPPAWVAQEGQAARAGIEGAYASIIAMQQAQVAAQIAYTEWLMRSGDEKLAMEKAQQAWSQKFQEVGQAYAQRATTAGITGQWDGQDTMAMQQQKYAQDLANRTFAEQQLQNQNATGLGLLQAQSQLQGPRDWAKYWQMSASAPQGLTSALSSLAGRYNFAPGDQGTPGPATLQSRTQDLLSGGQQGAGAPAGTGGTGDGQAGNAWGWNLQNWQRMAPSMQQGVLGRRRKRVAPTGRTSRTS